jgi:hypothetical protein
MAHGQVPVFVTMIELHVGCSWAEGRGKDAPDLWEVRLAILPEDPLVIGYVAPASAGRKLLASLALPHLLDIAADERCKQCGEGPFDQLQREIPKLWEDEPPKTFKPVTPRYALKWASFWLNHGHRCSRCADDDLIPLV